MGVFNNIKIEIVIFLILSLIVFITFKLDNTFYSFFFEINKGSGDIYLKEFFVDITELGNSAWYFGISIFFIIFYYVCKKFNFIKINELDKKINFFIFFIIYLAVNGIFVQVLKHVLGRPRPNYSGAEDSFGFSFFTFDSNFHSFPSGHASTIFIVFLILSKIIPQLKYYFFILAMIIAISRVFVGAHFFTDIVASGLIAIITFKILNNFFDKKFKKYLFHKINFQADSEINYVIMFFLGMCLFLTLGPTIDLYVANFFYNGESQFSLQSFDFLSLLFREILIPLILIYILLIPILGRYISMERVFIGYKFSVKEILLIWITQVLSMIIFINVILKNFWGRARPDDILQLGGDEVFTPWYKISNSCETNCSFVSGDASVGFSIIILYFITKNKFFLYTGIVVGFILGFIRILAGGHFLSDVVFSGLIVVVLNLIIFKIYEKYYE